MNKYNLAKEVGKNEIDAATIEFTNGKIKINGDNEFETDIITQCDFEFSFMLSLSKFDIIVSSLKEEKELVIKYQGNNKPIFIDNAENEFLILPIRKL